MLRKKSSSFGPGEYTAEFGSGDNSPTFLFKGGATSKNSTRISTLTENNALTACSSSSENRDGDVTVGENEDAHGYEREEDTLSKLFLSSKQSSSEANHKMGKIEILSTNMCDEDSDDSDDECMNYIEDKWEPEGS